MKKPEITLTEIFFEREKFFKNLTDRLIATFFFILARNLNIPFFRSLNFPLTKEDYEKFDLFREEKINQGQKSFKDLIKELDKNMEDPKRRVDLKDLGSFNELFSSSQLIENLYQMILAQNDLTKNFQLLNRLETFGNRITSQAFELIGYWTAKMEESKRGKTSASVKTKAKEEKYNEFEKMLNEHLKEHPEEHEKVGTEFINKAKIELKYTDDRSIKNMIKVWKEKTTLLRKIAGFS